MHLSNQLSLILSELEDNRAAADTIKTALDTRSNDNNYITLWTATSYDASGRLQGEVFGNGVLTRREIDPVTGHINRITTGMGDQLLRNISYSYDQRDNILSREDQLSGISETYSYDHMDRLSNWNYHDTHQQLSRTYEYDNRGNITYKTDAGTLEYDNSNRLIQRSHNNQSYTYSYDAGGNLLTGDDRTYIWNSFNKITSITSNRQNINFSYDATNQRLTKQTTNTTTHYINRSFEIHHTTDQAGQEITNMRHHLFVGNEVVATYEKTLIDGQKTVDKTAYHHRDALGNIDTVTNNQGEVVIRRQFTPYGEEIPAPALLPTPHLGNWTKSGGTIETDMGNKTITFAVTQTGTVTIELDSPIDSYLYLQNQDSQLLHQDDNSGTGNNAKITIHLEKGLYKIIAATAHKHQSGEFSLSLSANASFAAVRFNTQDLRGYTSHEHINETGLINMNARLYDPVIARFISPDTFIPDPYTTLSYNRYMYVLGNPVKYLDPSGHWSIGISIGGNGFSIGDHGASFSSTYGGIGISSNGDIYANVGANYNTGIEYGATSVGVSLSSGYYHNFGTGEGTPYTTAGAYVEAFGLSYSYGVSSYNWEGVMFGLALAGEHHVGGGWSININTAYAEYKEFLATNTYLYGEIAMPPAEFLATLKQGDVTFGTRALDYSPDMINFPGGFGDALNIEFLHEEMFFLDANGNLQSRGFYNTGYEENWAFKNKEISRYKFNGKIYRNQDITSNMFDTPPAGFTHAHQYNFLFNNCQDYAQAMRNQLR